MTQLKVLVIDGRATMSRSTQLSHDGTIHTISILDKVLDYI